MILSDRYKFAFVHIPKTGGSSITASLAEFLKPPPYEFVQRGWQFRYHTGSMHSLSNKPPPKYFCFTVARNPWDRVASFYLTRFGKKSKSLAEFLKRGHKFMSPLQHFIEPDLLSDYIRFETLEQDFTRICAELKIPIKQPFPHLHFHDAPHDHAVPWYRELHTSETENLVRKRYAVEIERFNFEF